MQQDLSSAQSSDSSTSCGSRHACFCIIDAPEGIIVVRHERKYGIGAPFKFPGGRERPGEGPLACLYREQEQETGVDDIEQHNPRLVARFERRSHDWRLYYVKHTGLPTKDKLKKFGDEGEEVQVWSPQELLATFEQDEGKPRELQQFHYFYRNAGYGTIRAIVEGRQPEFID